PLHDALPIYCHLSRGPGSIPALREEEHVSPLSGARHPSRVRELGLPLPPPQPAPLEPEHPEEALLGHVPGPPCHADGERQGDQDHRQAWHRRRRGRDPGARGEDLMAKKSKIAAQERRRAVVRRYAERRAELKRVIASRSASDADQAAARAELRRQPRDASPTRL